ncbi:cdp-diacylglycerol-glycerol-3-phosphate 3-phosphatidyltransferase [Lentinula edodes]|uniref:CDP-diacylglycerol--glycerol-3-phosphate 3-phosphatidyltransferase n=1 Tax=Lentinula edodes TaxID=5353 RepID=A0A1Q3E378_LENED|nr:cdp-diacylglycerol-glycerol-3-phosphate 3-phosphatidyltransferase [Lentinula edodes]
MLLSLRSNVLRSSLNINSLCIASRLSSTCATRKFQPILHDIAAELKQHQPKFSIPADGIRILSQPSEFYSTLLDMIRRAEERIFLSSLYIGSSENELIATLMNRLAEKQSLHLYLLLDLNRSTRPGPASTAAILLPLLRAFPDRVHVSLFRSPNLRGILAKIVPPRFKEGWGTWHAKIYGVDNDVIISGANLSKDYFTNRRDRYIRFTAQVHLSDYCFDFLREITPFSYRLLPSEATTLPNNGTNRNSQICGDYALIWSDPETHPHRIGDKMQQALTSFQATNRQKFEGEEKAGRPCTSSSNVTLFPIIQAGQFCVREEEHFFQLLFGHLKKAAMRAYLPSVGSLPAGVSSIVQERPLMDLTSGYFSLYHPYQKLFLLHPQVDVRIVAASPKANGFYGSQGISGRIPEGYTFLEQKFMRAVRRTADRFSIFGSGQSNIDLSEWEKDGWTYHAKGLWLSPSADSSPVLTLFGSTNLNSRSADIDTELSFVMALPPSTASPAANDPVETLREQLAREVAVIREDVKPWKGDSRKVRWLTKLIVFLVGKKL